MLTVNRPKHMVFKKMLIGISRQKTTKDSAVDGDSHNYRVKRELGNQTNMMYSILMHP